MQQINDLLKAQMTLQMGVGQRPLLNMFALNGFDLVVRTFPTWSTWMNALMCPRRNGTRPAVPQSILKTPRASITCERGVVTSQNRGSQPVQGIYASRMDAVVQYVTTLPAMRSLLAVSQHDYLPNEYDPVCLEADVYFELQEMKIADGQLELVKFKLYCYDHDVQHLQQFVDTCNTDYERRMANKLGSHRYYFDQMIQTKSKGIQNPLPMSHLVYTKSKFTTNRTFNNVFFEERDHVRDRVNFFLNRRDWYDQKGIPYTLGFMFHGPPGVGKTSTIKAIANEGKRHIVNVQLSEIKTKSQLQHLFFNDEIHVYNGVQTEKYTIPVSERLYVIEDIDAMGDTVLRREWKKPVQTTSKKEEDMFDRKEEEKEVIDLAFILNLLDGTLEANGRILAITTNFPERIDRALIRPGRIDMIVNFKKCSVAIVQEMVRSFYDSETVVDDMSLNYKWSPAEVNQILFRNFGNVEAGVAELIRLSASQDGGAADQPAE
jgi:ATPase family associated with various cellular activities (AAA)